MNIFLSMGAIIILSIVETPNNCKWFKGDKFMIELNWMYTDTCEVRILPKKLQSENNFVNLRKLTKANWQHDVNWIYANTWIDFFFSSFSNILKDAGFDPLRLLNISDVIWGNALLLNLTANLNLTGGKMSYISNLERQGNAFMSFSSGNLVQLNITVRNSYLFCRFHYDFEATIFPYIWHSGDLFARVKNVTSNLLLTSDTSKDILDLEKLSILNIESIDITLDNNLLVFDSVVSKVVNYILPIYMKRIMQISEETLSDVIYTQLIQLSALWFGT